MKILRTIADFEQIRPGCVLSIGNFDGVHLGHQEILTAASGIARQRNAEIVALTFEPHPVAILYPERAPGVLTPLPLKLNLLQDYADDCVIVLEDSKELLCLGPEDFVDKFLAETIKPAVIVEGDDFNFGAARKGDIETLKELGARKGFEVFVVGSRRIQLATGQTLRVSSTMIRYMLESGHVSEAAVALSRPYRLVERITTGRGKGKELGFPTLNMQKPKQIIPAEGVYAGFVEMADSQEHILKNEEHIPAVFSIGQARTFGDEHPLLIEAHLLTGQARDASEQWMAMDFVQRIRSQHKFTTPEELSRQIAKDCEQARAILAKGKRRTNEVFGRRAQP
ncbi:MAG: riboflavin biosynthesis protein RibF [Phycisphaerales bacterium]|nr:MAG: riboflavin biosynthesis protein RibF [Phycisphaerales bacterium]